MAPSHGGLTPGQSSHTRPPTEKNPGPRGGRTWGPGLNPYQARGLTPGQPSHARLGTENNPGARVGWTWGAGLNPYQAVGSGSSAESWGSGGLGPPAAPHRTARGWNRTPPIR